MQHFRKPAFTLEISARDKKKLNESRADIQDHVSDVMKKRFRDGASVSMDLSIEGVPYVAHKKHHADYKSLSRGVTKHLDNALSEHYRAYPGITPQEDNIEFQSIRLGSISNDAVRIRFSFYAPAQPSTSNTPPKLPLVASRTHKAPFDAKKSLDFSTNCLGALVEMNVSSDCWNSLKVTPATKAIASPANSLVDPTILKAIALKAKIRFNIFTSLGSQYNLDPWASFGHKNRRTISFVISDHHAIGASSRFSRPDRILYITSPSVNLATAQETIANVYDAHGNPYLPKFVLDSVEIKKFDDNPSLARQQMQETVETRSNHSNSVVYWVEEMDGSNKAVLCKRFRPSSCFCKISPEEALAIDSDPKFAFCDDLPTFALRYWTSKLDLRPIQIRECANLVAESSIFIGWKAVSEYSSHFTANGAIYETDHIKSYPSYARSKHFTGIPSGQFFLGRYPMQVSLEGVYPAFAIIRRMKSPNPLISRIIEFDGLNRKCLPWAVYQFLLTKGVEIVCDTAIYCTRLHRADESNVDLIQFYEQFSDKTNAKFALVRHIGALIQGGANTTKSMRVLTNDPCEVKQLLYELDMLKIKHSLRIRDHCSCGDTTNDSCECCRELSSDEIKDALKRAKTRFEVRYESEKTPISQLLAVHSTILGISACEQIQRWISLESQGKRVCAINVDALYTLESPEPVGDNMPGGWRVKKLDMVKGYYRALTRPFPDSGVSEYAFDLSSLDYIQTSPLIAPRVLVLGSAGIGKTHPYLTDPREGLVIAVGTNVMRANFASKLSQLKGIPIDEARKRVLTLAKLLRTDLRDAEEKEAVLKADDAEIAKHSADNKDRLAQLKDALNSSTNTDSIVAQIASIEEETQLLKEKRDAHAHEKTFESMCGKLAGISAIILDEFTLQTATTLTRAINRAERLRIPLIVLGDFAQVANTYENKPLSESWFVERGFFIQRISRTEASPVRHEFAYGTYLDSLRDMHSKKLARELIKSGRFAHESNPAQNGDIAHIISDCHKTNNLYNLARLQYLKEHGIATMPFRVTQKRSASIVDGYLVPYSIIREQIKAGTRDASHSKLDHETRFKGEIHSLPLTQEGVFWGRVSADDIAPEGTWLEPAFSVTIDSFQGCTIPDATLIAIDCNMTRKNCLYTAITRAKTASQIRLIPLAGSDRIDSPAKSAVEAPMMPSAISADEAIVYYSLTKQAVKDYAITPDEYETPRKFYKLKEAFASLKADERVFRDSTGDKNHYLVGNPRRVIHDMYVNGLVLHEIIPEGKRKFFLDLDSGTAEEQQDIMETAKELLQHLMDEQDGICYDDKPVRYTAVDSIDLDALSRCQLQKKVSSHVIYNVSVANTHTMKWIYEQLRRYVKNPSIIDNMCKTNQSIRVALTRSKGRTTIIRKLDASYEDTLIMADAELNYRLVREKTHANKPTKHYEGIKGDIEQRLTHFTIQDGDYDGGFWLTRIRGQDSFCAICNRSHSSNGVFVGVEDDKPYIACPRNDYKERCPVDDYEL